MMFKKGQAAMEFLMTYGWAILVVLIAIGVLIFLVGNPSNLVGDSCRIGSPLNCGTTLVADGTADTITIELTNGLANSIEITAAADIALTATDYADCDAITSPAVPITISAGAKETIIIDCGAIDLVSGDKVKSPFSVTYTDNANPSLGTLVRTGDIVVSVK